MHEGSREIRVSERSCDYIRDGVGYLQESENEIETPTLFDFMEA